MNAPLTSGMLGAINDQLRDLLRIETTRANENFEALAASEAREKQLRLDLARAVEARKACASLVLRTWRVIRGQQDISAPRRRRGP